MPPIRANDLPQYKAKAFALAPTLVDPPNWSFVRRHRISRLSGDGEKVKEAWRDFDTRRIAVQHIVHLSAESLASNALLLSNLLSSQRTKTFVVNTIDHQPPRI
jgi:hypothetical protein